MLRERQRDTWSPTVAEAIANESFEVFEAARQCGINIGVLSSLIQAGALDGYDVSRSYLCYEAQLWNIFTDREKALMMHIGDEFDYHVVKTYKKLRQSYKIV